MSFYNTVLSDRRYNISSLDSFQFSETNQFSLFSIKIGVVLVSVSSQENLKILNDRRISYKSPRCNGH